MDTGKENLIFGLDIGTRSIVGTVGYRTSAREFVAVAQSVRFHETRAMLDGQIHDIGKVGSTISYVKKRLEERLDKELGEVCIAAAGRVLRTVTVNVEEDFEAARNVYVSYVGFLSNVQRCMVSAITSPICRKPQRSSKNARFTISLAALTMHGMLPPRSNAS